MKCWMILHQIFQPLLYFISAHLKVLINCFIISNLNSGAVHYNDVTLFRQQRDFCMKNCIFLRKITSTTSVFCLATTDLPQLDKSMNWRNEHFLHLSDFWKMRNTISWIHVI